MYEVKVLGKVFVQTKDEAREIAKKLNPILREYKVLFVSWEEVEEIKENNDA